MSVYRKMKATNLATGKLAGYLGVGTKLYCVLAEPVERAGDVTWATKESDLKNIGFPGTKAPTSPEDWARLGLAYLAVKNTAWDIAGEQLWLGRGSQEWAHWAHGTRYTRVQWNADNTVSNAPEGDLKLYVDMCPERNWWHFRWGSPSNPAVVRLDFV